MKRKNYLLSFFMILFLTNNLYTVFLSNIKKNNIYRKSKNDDLIELDKIYYLCNLNNTQIIANEVTVYNNDVYYSNINNFIDINSDFKNIVDYSCLSMNKQDLIKYECKECIKFFRGGFFKEGFLHNMILNDNKYKNVDECLNLINEKIFQVSDITKDTTHLELFGINQYVNPFCII